MTFAASTTAAEATQLISLEDLLWLTAVRKVQKGTSRRSTVPERVLGPSGSWPNQNKRRSLARDRCRTPGVSCLELD